VNVQVAFLTGQSDPQSCELSPQQSAFLGALPLAASAKVWRNFPYRDDLGPYRAIPLWRASANNARQVAAAQLPSFRAAHGARVAALLDRADRTLLLAGSCGIELFDRLDLSRELEKRVTIVAYGPVARRRPRSEHVTIGSRRDPLSLAFFPHPDISIDEPHLAYLRSPIVFATCCERLTALVAATA
jgi:hypothetical protein